MGELGDVSGSISKTPARSCASISERGYMDFEPITTVALAEHVKVRASRNTASHGRFCDDFKLSVPPVRLHNFFRHSDTRLIVMFSGLGCLSAAWAAPILTGAIAMSTFPFTLPHSHTAMNGLGKLAVGMAIRCQLF
jgi:hypothetical protein